VLVRRRDEPVVRGACCADDGSARSHVAGTTSTDVPSTAATTATVDDDDVDTTDSSTSDRVDATDSTVVSATGVAFTTVVEPRPGDGPLSIDELLALGRPIVLSHAGGEDVHPHSTPFAYAESVDAGVDMLDLDVQLTATASSSCTTTTP
jgi:hypothetical protein